MSQLCLWWLCARSPGLTPSQEGLLLLGWGETWRAGTPHPRRACSSHLPELSHQSGEFFWTPHLLPHRNTPPTQENALSQIYSSSPPRSAPQQPGFLALKRNWCLLSLPLPLPFCFPPGSGQQPKVRGETDTAGTTLPHSNPDFCDEPR